MDDVFVKRDPIKFRIGFLYSGNFRSWSANQQVLILSNIMLSRIFAQLEVIVFNKNVTCLLMCVVSVMIKLVKKIFEELLLFIF